MSIKLGKAWFMTMKLIMSLKIQDKIEGDFKAHMQSDNGQYRNEIYERAESMIPQLDGTYNVSDSSNTDSHDYLDLATGNIIQYRTRGQKQRHKANEMAYANRCSAHIEYIKPNTRTKTQRQKVPDDEDIDMDKIVKDDKPRYDRKRATETERQLKEKRGQRTSARTDKVNTSGTGKNADINGKEGTKKGKPLHKKATKASQIKMSQNKGDKAKKGNPDTLLGDPMINTKKSTHKAKEKGQKDTIGINDIGIFEFISRPTKPARFRRRG